MAVILLNNITKTSKLKYFSKDKWKMGVFDNCMNLVRQS